MKKHHCSILVALAVYFTLGLALSAPALAADGSQIIDNNDAGFSSGPSAWPSSSFSPGGYNGSYRYASPGSSSKWARWTFTLTSSGNYEVFVQWTADDNRSPVAPYKIINNGSQVVDPVTMDQRFNGGEFISLGTYWLEAGTFEVTTYDTPTGYVIADAVKIESEDTPPPPPPDEIIIDDNDAGFNSGPKPWPSSSFSPGGYNGSYRYASPGMLKWARWTFTLSSSGSYEVFAQWTADENRSRVAPYTIINNGSQVGDPVTKDQRSKGGQFISLGTYWLGAGTVEVELNSTFIGYVIADAVKITLNEGSARWFDNGDGTITDMTTGLVWLKNVIDLPLKPWSAGCDAPYDNAFKVVCDVRPSVMPGLSDDSEHGDWRLPTRKELLRFVGSPEGVTWQNPRGFEFKRGTATEVKFWTSSSSVLQGNSWAYYVGLRELGGEVSVERKIDNLAIWPVRGGD